MKIAMLIRRLNVKGGTQRQFLELAREFVRRGHTIRIYTFSLDRARCYANLLDGLDVFVLNSQQSVRNPVRRWLGGVSGFVYENQLAHELASLIESDVNVINPHDSVVYRVAHYVKQQRPEIRVVWQLNDFPLATWALKKEQSLDQSFHPSPLRLLFARLRDWYDTRVYLVSQDVIMVLDEFNRKLVRTYLGRDAMVVRSGIDLAEFPYRVRAPIQGHRLQILAQGIFFPHRRFEDIIRAVALLVTQGFDPRLTIIGATASSPAYYQKLVHLVAAEGLEERIHFLGEVSERDLVRAYQECDCFVFANDLQTWGLAVFEAMAAGAPVIVSTGAGAHEVLTDGENALLVPPRDPAAIASATRRLLDDPRLASELSRRGRAFIKENISWSRYASDVLNIFKRIRAEAL